MASNANFSLKDFEKNLKFQGDNLNKLDGIGIKTLVERSKILNVKLEILGNKGEGTHIKLFVPIVTSK